jgi:poly-gamma-glutamate synthesis protein (capsule biosynthesis protein)
VWLDAAVPIAVRDPVAAWLVGRYAARATSAEAADLIVGLGLPVVLARWVYAVVAPFPTLADGVQWADIGRFWAGESGTLTQISEDRVTPTLFVSPETFGVLFGLLGPSSAKAPIEVAEPGELVDKAWAARPRAWAIVPFDELEPRWKVLRVDGASVLDKQLDVEKYPLAVPIGAAGAGAEELAATVLKDGKLLMNRETDKMTVLLMTGVTALTRNLAYRMEEKGLLYPQENIGDLLRDADLTHVSNEVSFTERCPVPVWGSSSFQFCSSPRYLELLRYVGVDVIELTGNHIKDYGSKPFTETLELYRKEGWPYFGGGENLEDARKTVPFTLNENKLGFAGCNWWGPPSVWATDHTPGAAPCYEPADMEYMRKVVGESAASEDILIFTFQYLETEEYTPTSQQRVDFRAMVDAGARIVSGSQSHQPQAIEFYRNGFIHYGLGNLFFDQMYSAAIRQQFADRHIIYKGRHISTELLTFMLEDYSQPRLMTSQERRDLLQAVFKASGW